MAPRLGIGLASKMSAGSLGLRSIRVTRLAFSQRYQATYFFRAVSVGCIARRMAAIPGSACWQETLKRPARPTSRSTHRIQVEAASRSGITVQRDEDSTWILWVDREVGRAGRI